ncbi:MAG: spore cortex biosynthesis protein YabQ [Butyricicoccus sp.]
MNSALGIELSGVLLFALAGLICAGISDILFTVRCVFFRGRLAEFLLDVLFMAVCALAIFLTTVSALQANLRGYMLGAFAVSAFAWKKTVGRLLRKLLCAIVRLPICAVCRICCGARHAFTCVCQRMKFVRMEKLHEKNEKDRNKPFFFFKNRLK